MREIRSILFLAYFFGNNLKISKYFRYICIRNCAAFRWLNPFMALGYSQTLQLDNLYECLDEDKSGNLGLLLQRFTSIIAQQKYFNIIFKFIVSCDRKNR